MTFRLLPALLAMAGLLSEEISANTASNLAPVVRLQGSDVSKGGTGTLIGALQSGDRYTMVILGTDHTARRVGPLATVGFGDMGSAGKINLSLASATNVRTTLYGANGTTDLSLIRLTVDLATLSAGERNALLAVVPLTVSAAPQGIPFVPFTFQAYTYGTDGGAFPGYGTQNSFSNQVDSTVPFSGSYTTNSAGSPLNYTETISQWDLDSVGGVPGEGTAVQGGSGSPMIVGGKIVGIQVNGSLIANAVNFGVAFSYADVDWLTATTANLLSDAVGPLPGETDLSFLAVSGGALSPAFDPGVTSYALTTPAETLTGWPIRLDPGGTVQVHINNGGFTTVDQKPAFSTAGNHALAIRDNGSVAIWGANAGNLLDVPATLENVTAVSAGGSHSLALKSDGTMAVWGYNFHEALAMPRGLGNIRQLVSNDDYHSFVLSASGQVTGWGLYVSGAPPTPLAVPPSLKGVVSVVCGSYHALALKRDGTVTGWGTNEFAETGHGLLDIPPGLNQVVAIAAQRYSSIALKRDGTVVTWGPNYSGYDTPPPGLSNVVAISVSEKQFVALKNDGTVVVWGDPYRPANYKPLPENFSGAVAIASGFDSHLAQKADGTLVGWGLNNISNQADPPPGLVVGRSPASPLFQLHEGLNRVEFVVTSQDGQRSRTYTVNVTRQTPAVPVVTAFAATNVEVITATLGAEVDAKGLGTTVSFEYGTDTNYGQTSSPQTLPAAFGTVMVSLPVSGLLPNTPYHFRAKAVNASGTTYGSDLTFTTQPVGASPVALDDVAGPVDEDDYLLIPQADLLANDLRGATNLPLTITAVSPVANCSIDLNAGEVVFRGAQDFFGTASFTYTASNGQGGVSTATVTVQVNPVADEAQISKISGPVILKNTTALVPFTVYCGDALDGVTVTATSDDQGVIPDDRIELQGTGAWRFVRLKPLPGATGVANITVTVSNGLWIPNSTTFRVTVTDNLGLDTQAAAITGLGFLLQPGYHVPQGGESSYAYDVSANGNVAAGVGTGLFPTYSEPFRWTNQSGIADLGAYPGHTETTPKAISANGTIVAGTTKSGVTEQSFIWSGGVFQTLPDGSQIQDLSGSGAFAVGYRLDDAQHRAITWTQATGVVDLLHSGFPDTMAKGISSDGSVIVGEGTDAAGNVHALVWQALGLNPIVLATLDGEMQASATAASADGAVIVGFSGSPGSEKAVRWVRGAGGIYQVQALEISTFFGPPSSSLARSVSADGTGIVGNTPQGAFFWDVHSGGRLLIETIGNVGVDTGLWRSLTEANAISADGRFVVGAGFVAGTNDLQAFRIELPHGPERPVLSAIADQTALPGAILEVPFTLTDPDTGFESLTCNGFSGDFNLVAFASISGTDSGRILTIHLVPGQTGVAAMNINADDGFGTVTRQFNLTVNTPPVALAQTVNTAANTALEITPTGSDAEGQPLTFSITTPPDAGKGVVSLAGGTFNFTPAPNFLGTATFQFRAHDGLGYSAPATITVNVLGEPPAVTTLAPSAVGTTTATLRATINPNYLATGAWFVFDGNVIGDVAVPAGGTPVTITRVVTGLEPGSAHSFRAAAYNPAATESVFGGTINFNAAGGPPAVTTLEPASVTPTKATLRATVNPNLVDTTVTFFVGGTAVHSVNVPAGTDPTTVTFNYHAGLIPGQAVTFTASAANTSNQTGSGSNVNFNLLSSDSTLGNSNTFIYTANAGWINGKPATAFGFRTGDTVCSGFLYGANIGWIHAGTGEPANGIRYTNTSGDYGVNVMNDGTLRGYAWGQNIGWITFDNTGNPRIDPATGQLAGYAYSANIGWINLGDANFHATTTELAILDTDADGISDAWEIEHAGNLTSLAADRDSDDDGISDLNEFIAGTDPQNAADFFKVGNFTQPQEGQDFILDFPSTPTRFYRVETTFEVSLPWDDTGFGWIPGSATGITSVNLGAPLDPARFYRVSVKRPLSL